VSIDPYRAARDIRVWADLKSECWCREDTGKNDSEQFTDGSQFQCQNFMIPNFSQITDSTLRPTPRRGVGTQSSTTAAWRAERNDHTRVVATQQAPPGGGYWIVSLPSGSTNELQMPLRASWLPPRAASWRRSGRWRRRDHRPVCHPPAPDACPMRALTVSLCFP
jgi:hypothetical protein